MGSAPAIDRVVTVLLERHHCFATGVDRVRRPRLRVSKLKRDGCVEQGTLTGKEEPVRRRIEEQYAELIESLYANPADWMN